MELNDYKPGSIAQWADTELRHGKAQYTDEFVWGRKVIQAIDVDDCIALGLVLEPRTNPGMDINTQTTVLGYAGYLWTIAIHRYLGDTALHYAIKSRKLMCIYMLLFMGADVLLANADGTTCSTLLTDIYSTDHCNMLYDAKRYLINTLHPMQLRLLPVKFGCVNMEREAWKLLHHGRLLYHELPQALQQVQVDPHIVTMKTRRRLSFNNTQVQYSTKSKTVHMKPSLSDLDGLGFQDAPWMAFQTSSAVVGDLVADSVVAGSSMEESDESKVKPAAVPRTFSLSSDEKLSEHDSIVSLPSRPTTAPAQGNWIKMVTDEGHEYYHNTVTHESSWVEPEGYVPAPVEPVPTEPALMPAIAADSLGFDESMSSAPPTPYQRQPLHLDDVWTKNSLQDILDLIEKQNSIRCLRATPAAGNHVLFGLPLLSSVKLGNRLEQISDHESMLASGDRQALAAVYAQYTQSESSSKLTGQLLAAKGVGNLKFAGVRALEGTIRSMGGAGQMESKSNKQLVASPHAISDKLLFGADASRRFNTSSVKTPGSMKSAGSADPLMSPYIEALYSSPSNRRKSMAMSEKTSRSVFLSGSVKAMSTKFKGGGGGGGRSVATVEDTKTENNNDHLYREIIELSTYNNLKYIAIGDQGASRLSQVLYNDLCIVKLILPNARITDDGCIALADIIPSMRQLVYLDLSNNCIGDEGVLALADALVRTYNTANNSMAVINAEHADNEQYLQRVEELNNGIVSVTTCSIAGNRAKLRSILELLRCLIPQTGPRHRHKLYWLR